MVKKKASGNEIFVTAFESISVGTRDVFRSSGSSFTVRPLILLLSYSSKHEENVLFP